MTLLIVEHDLDFVMRASDRVIVMNDGRVIAQGSPDEVRVDERVVDAYLGDAPRERMSLLEVDALEAGYDDALVLRGVSLDAGADEIVAVIGPNGAGKSTMLKAVYGLVTRAARVGALRRRGRHRACAPTG